MTPQNTTAYLPTPISKPPTEDGFYFTLMGEQTGNNWFKEGRWLDEILNSRPTEVTHWLRPVDLSRMIGEAFEAGEQRQYERANLVKIKALDKDDYVQSILNPK